MHASTPLVSFVVPCHNYARFLPDCLRSIFAQQPECPSIEVIAIDDASTDDTWDILSSWNDGRLKAIRHRTNQGHAFTVSEGLAAATGRFVARIDPDDRYRPEFLATLLPLFEGNSRIGLVHGDAAMIDATGTITAERCLQPHGGEYFAGNVLLEILRKNYICSPTAIARREAWRKHLPVWNDLVVDDMYFNVMIARDWHVGYAPTVVAEYRVHGSNHHSRITHDRTEEPSVLRLLDWVFSHAELEPHVERRKRIETNAIYAEHYLDFADKYFGIGAYSDARRCYLHGLGRNPRRVRLEFVRRFLATFLSPAIYNGAKQLLRR